MILAYVIGALGGSIPLPASIGPIGGMAGMPILYGVGHNAAIAAVLLHQAIGLLVPLVGGAIAYGSSGTVSGRFGRVTRKVLTARTLPRLRGSSRASAGRRTAYRAIGVTSRPPTPRGRERLA